MGEIPCIFLGGLHRAERAIAGRILDIAAGNLPWPDIDPGKALPWVEGKTGLALAPGQAYAVRAALSSKVSVITGGPGVGKTTIVTRSCASCPPRMSTFCSARRPGAPPSG